MMVQSEAEEPQWQLSSPQAEIWLAQHMDTASPAYSIALSMEIYGRLDVVAFESALRETVAEIDAVNVRFVGDAYAAHQQPMPFRPWTFSLRDVSIDSAPEIAATAAMEADLAKHFVSFHEELGTAILFRIAKDRFV